MSRIDRLAIVVGILGIVIPILIAKGLTYGISSVTPFIARQMLIEKSGRSVLLDVRPREQYGARHLKGSINIPLGELSEGNREGLAPRGSQSIYVICRSGKNSLSAARILKRDGYVDVTNVLGGMEAWSYEPETHIGTDQLYDFVDAGGNPKPIPFRPMSFFEQTVAFASAFVVKPAYGLLSFLLILILWKKRSGALASVRWGLIFFFLGEQACAVNYLFYGERSRLLEMWHSLGMVFAFSFITYSILEAVDRHIVKYTEADARCALLDCCHRCAKQTEVACNLERLFVFLIIGTMLVALMPLSTQYQWVTYRSGIFGRAYLYTHAALYQAFEMRLCPLMVEVLFGASLGILLWKKNNPVPLAKVFFAAGAGPLGFSFLRGMLFKWYSENLVWMILWEEFTELLMVAAIIVILWVFRDEIAQRKR